MVVGLDVVMAIISGDCSNEDGEKYEKEFHFGWVGFLLSYRVIFETQSDCLFGKFEVYIRKFFDVNSTIFDGVAIFFMKITINV